LYRPNFCAECGDRIVRLKWRVWTSRSFCDSCATRFRTQCLKIPLITATVLLVIGFIFGRAGRPKAPPLVIERQGNSPLSDAQYDRPPANGAQVNQRPEPQQKPHEQIVYICGARTRKGRPCSRRVHVPERCWQHLGSPAMLPEEKLKIKG
jgi:hypothetical protein